MSGTERSNTTDAHAPLDIDLYCLNCGYNLRGLPGDPIRCPECGQSSSIAVLRAARRRVYERVLRGLDSDASFCGVFGGVILLGALLSIAAPSTFLRQLPPFVGVAGVVWSVFFGANLFKYRRCRAWPKAFVVHHAYLSAYFVGSALMVFASVLAAAKLIELEERGEAMLIPAVLLVAVTVVVAFVKNPLGFLRRRARASMSPVAEELTRGAGSHSE